MTDRDARTGLQLAAFALSMRAKINDVDAMEVDELQGKAAQLLEAGDPLLYAINTFATQYQLCHADPAGLAVQGHNLSDAIARITRPDPPDIGRKDIHG